jgi:hypothetical protein
MHYGVKTCAIILSIGIAIAIACAGAGYGWHLSHQPPVFELMHK